MSFGGQAPPGPAKELKKHSPDSLAVAGRKYGNKGKRKKRREESKKKKGNGSCAPRSFL